MRNIFDGRAKDGVLWLVDHAFCLFQFHFIIKKILPPFQPHLVFDGIKFTNCEDVPLLVVLLKNPGSSRGFVHECHQLIKVANI